MTAGTEVAVALAGTGAEISPGADRDAVGGVTPACVARPGTPQQAAQVMRAAAGLGMAMVPRGSGSKIFWGPPPARCDVVVDMSRMDRVIEHAAGDLVVTVEAGVTLGRLAEVLAEAGQRLMLDGPPGATVGGAIAAGAAGPLRLRYGTPRDLLIGITVVRPDGRMARSGGKVVKNVAGYDLGKLFAGSRGTLGLITEATFRLHPLPAAAAFVTAEYDDATAAAEAVTGAAASALLPTAVEADRPRPGGPIRVGALLDGTASGVADRADRMIALLARTGRDAGAAQDPPEWWAGIGEVAGAAGGTLVRLTFWAAELRRVLDAVDGVAADTRVKPAVGGPAGAGVLYAYLDVSEDADQVAMFVRALRGAAPGAPVSPGGPPRGSVVVVTAPPAVRGSIDMWGPVPALDLMRAVKRQFDPDNRMAPGRFAGGI